MKNDMRKNVTHITSEIFKKDDEIAVVLTCNMTNVTIKRYAKPGYDYTKTPPQMPKFVKTIPATVRWSGSSNSPVEHAEVFANMVVWATRIANNLTRAKNPLMLSTEAIMDRCQTGYLRVATL